MNPFNPAFPKPPEKPASVRLAQYLAPIQRSEVEVAEQNGHFLWSQGCSMFRCAHCSATGYIDDADTGRAFGGGLCPGAAQPQ